LFIGEIPLKECLLFGCGCAADGGVAGCFCSGPMFPRPCSFLSYQEADHSLPVSLQRGHPTPWEVQTMAFHELQIDIVVGRGIA